MPLGKYIANGFMNNLGQHFLLTFPRLIFPQGSFTHRNPTFSYSPITLLGPTLHNIFIFGCQGVKQILGNT